MNNIILTVLTIFLGTICYKAINKLLKKSLNIIDHVNDVTNINIEEQTTKTVYKIVQSIALYVIILIVLIVIFSIYNVDLKALLVSAGVAGLVIAIGMQDLIKDIISGFFILIEKSYLIGDLVEKNGVTGVVESIGLKTTKIRTADNTLMIIPNNLMLPIVNRSKNKDQVSFTINISNKHSITEIKKLFNQEIEKLEDSKLEIVGVIGTTDFSNIYRFKADESEKYDIVFYRELIITMIENYEKSSVNK